MSKVTRKGVKGIKNQLTSRHKLSSLSTLSYKTGDVISFAGGLPDDELFPMKGIEDAFARVFATGKGSALQYAETEGYRPLREEIIKRMNEKKGIMNYSSDEVLVTTGSQQAIDLFSRIMLGPEEKENGRKKNELTLRHSIGMEEGYQHGLIGL